MIRVHSTFVISMTGSGMATAAVDNETDDLLESMKKLGLEEKKEVKEETAEEKGEKAMTMLQK
jgi:hypothetical protein